MSAYQHYQYEESISTRNGLNVTVGAAASAGAALAPGRWECVSTTDCWIKRGASTVAAVAAGLDSHYRASGYAFGIVITEAERKAGTNYISAIQDSTSGTLYIRPVSR